MTKLINTRVQLPLLCAALLLVSACSTVTPEQLSAVEAKATSAMSDARKAASDAASAMKAAQAAQSSADAAQATADAAKSAADSAMSCCNENKDRIERMFEQTMKK
ncbi:MAG: alanine-zipper protein [Gammaproteobacteria bacterium]